MNKSVRSLIKSCEPKVTTIKETKVIIITLSLDHLLGSLITHEMIICEDQPKKKTKGRELPSKLLGIMKKSLMTKKWFYSQEIQVLLQQKCK